MIVGVAVLNIRGVGGGLVRACRRSSWLIVLNFGHCDMPEDIDGKKSSDVEMQRAIASIAIERPSRTNSSDFRHRWRGHRTFVDTYNIMRRTMERVCGVAGGFSQAVPGKWYARKCLNRRRIRGALPAVKAPG